MHTQLHAIDTCITLQSNFSGSVLVTKDDLIIFNKAYGMADYELDVANTPDTKFRIASITKQFTALSIMQLQEKGVLNIHDSLDNYIPDYPQGNTITIAHLLSHTSGIADIGAEWNSIKIFPLSLDESVERFKYKPLESVPGSTFAYSNSNFFLLTYIIQKVSRKSYADYIQHSICAPLGMHDTGYDHHDPIVKKRSRGYSYKNNILQNVNYFNPEIAVGSGGLYSTVADLAKFDKGLRDYTLISPESFKLMTEKQIAADNKGNDYGYGWFLTTIQNRRACWYDGAIDGTSSMFLHFLDEKLTIIILSNIEGCQIPLSHEIAKIVLENK